MNYALINKLKEVQIQLENVRTIISSLVDDIVLSGKMPPPRCEPHDRSSDDAWPGPTMIQFEMACLEGIRSFPDEEFTTEQLVQWVEKHRPHLLPHSSKKARAAIAAKLSDLHLRGLINHAVKNANWRRTALIDALQKKAESEITKEAALTH